MPKRDAGRPERPDESDRKTTGSKESQGCLLCDAANKNDQGPGDNTNVPDIDEIGRDDLITNGGLVPPNVLVHSGTGGGATFFHGGYAMLCLILSLSALAEIEITDNPTIQEMFRVNNLLRRGSGKREQRLSTELTNAAQDHARFMARSNILSHYSNGTPHLRAAKWNYEGKVSENIATGLSTAQGCFAIWSSSKPHWATILSNAQDAGFGCAESEQGRKFWVALYGYPGSAFNSHRQKKITEKPTKNRRAGRKRKK